MSIKQGGNTIAGSVGVYPLNERNISKCITEIPQDIKLELNNGTLTLKAGSKVYVPNGVGVFDEVTVASDTTFSYSGNNTWVLVYHNGSIGIRELSNCYSGTSAPSGQTYMVWYDTTNNLIKTTSNGGSTWTSGLALPLGIITISGGTITSIDQVFNGFGYIGSTRFVLPNIKWLSPDGRNADGTLKSIQRTNTRVLVETLFSGTVNSIVMVLSTGSVWTSGKYIESETEPNGSYIIWYKPSENILRNKAEGNWSINNNIVVYGYYDTVSDRITSFKTKQPFHAVDYDVEFIGHQSKPSNKYIDITPGASGTIYNMPWDGYLCVGALHPDDANWINIGIDVLDSYSNFLFNVGGTYNLNNQTYWFLVPVSKGFKVRIYNNDFTLNRLRFIYANGSV